MLTLKIIAELIEHHSQFSGCRSWFVGSRSWLTKKFPWHCYAMEPPPPLLCIKRAEGVGRSCLPISGVPGYAFRKLDKAQTAAITSWHERLLNVQLWHREIIHEQTECTCIPQHRCTSSNENRGSETHSYTLHTINTSCAFNLYPAQFSYSTCTLHKFKAHQNTHK